MANYENKLSEWFKKVEKQEQEVKAKKHTGSSQPFEESKPIVEEAPRTPQIREVEIESPVREAPASVVATVETVGVIADTTLADTAFIDPPASIPAPAPVIEPEPEVRFEAESELPLSAGEDAAKIFGDEEIPQVEDFLSFLNRSPRTGVARQIEAEEPFMDDARDQRALNMFEGTGEPRPISTPRPAPEPVVEPEPPAEAPQVELRAEIQPQAQVQPEVRPQIEPQPYVAPPVQPVAAPKPAPAPQPLVHAASDETQAGWDRMPRHLQTLFGTPSNEIAQNSYKAFKETREDLIQRLLDPIISLEEAARILNVCPTTVRRYTNRGVLQHYRTAGNQRRFKLSDVLVFMEGGSRRTKSASDETLQPGD